MKQISKIALALSLTFIASGAQAMHIYASYDCTSGNVGLRYDGPGSNYAVGGYSNFYTPTSTDGILSYEDIQDGTKLGHDVGGSQLEVLYKVEKSVQIGDITTITPDPKTCEIGEYEESEWKSFRYIRVTDISSKAAKALKIKKGQLVKFTCQETLSTPADCQN